MPLALTCDELAAGMHLAEPVLFKGMVMVPGGKALTASDCRALKQRFGRMTIRIADPFLDDAVEFQDDSHDRKVAQTVHLRIARYAAEVHQQYTSSRPSKEAGINVAKAKQVVADAIEYLKSNGIEIIIISSGLYRLARKVATELGINTFYANRIIESEGVITGSVVVDSPYHSKGEILKSEAARSGISTARCLAIGDDRNDVSLFEEAGTSIAFGKAHPELIEAAGYVVESGTLLDVIPIIKE